MNPQSKKLLFLKNNVISLPKTKNKLLSEAIEYLDDDLLEIALDKFKVLVDQDIPEAYFYMGAIYEYGGKNLESDFVNAKFYYEESITRHGTVESYLGLVRLYYYGKGVDQNYCKVYEYCKILSEDCDNEYANFILGKLYMDGLYVNKDSDIASEYFKKSWAKGYVFGLTYLGILEQKRGHFIKGWSIRIKAALIGLKIAKNNIDDPRIREI